MDKEKYVISNGKMLKREPLKLYVRFKLEDDEGNIVGAGVSTRMDYQVDLDVFRQLLDLGMIGDFNSEPTLMKELEKCKRSPFYKHNDTEGYCPRGQLSSVEEIQKGLLETEKNNRAEQIDDRFEGSDHITIICGKCGTMYHTKNIGHIGARSIFAGEHGECDCDFSELRKLSDEEFEQILKDNNITEPEEEVKANIFS